MMIKMMMKMKMMLKMMMKIIKVMIKRVLVLIYKPIFLKMGSYLKALVTKNNLSKNDKIQKMTKWKKMNIIQKNQNKQIIK